MRMQGRHRGLWWKILLGFVLFVGVLVLVVRLLVDPIATDIARRELNELPEYRAELTRVHVEFFPPGVRVVDPKLVKDTAGGEKEPAFYARSVWVSVYWRELLRGQLVGAVRVESPRVFIIAAGKAPTSGASPKGQSPTEPPNLEEKLEGMMPLRVDRIEVLDGGLHFVDGTEPQAPRVRVRDIEATVENFATRAALMRGLPTTVAMSGTVEESGKLSAYVSIDPLEEQPSFAGRFRLDDLKLQELNDFIAAKTDLKAEQGEFSVYAEFHVRDGAINGGVKPLLKNVEVGATDPGFLDWLKQGAADVAIDLFSDRVEGREAVATVIPIKGRLTDPNPQLWPTVFGVIRNAFVVGLAEGFGRLPPETAGRQQGVLNQARRALDRDSGAVKAQPRER